MITGLDEAVLRQADNLFLLRLPFEEDIHHVAKSALVDRETIAAFVVRLRRHHALAIGNVTGQYPLIFRVDPLDGVNTAGETQFFFRQEAREQGRKVARKEGSEGPCDFAPVRPDDFAQLPLLEVVR